jgi:preprotein translocase subunit SecG
MQTILIFLLLVIAIVMIGLVLLQQGKGAEVGAAFGSGASNTVFGSAGSGSFLMKVTLVLAVLFFAICILLARMAVQQNEVAQIIQLPPQQTSVPVNVTLPQVNKPVTNNSSVPNIPANK